MQHRDNKVTKYGLDALPDSLFPSEQVKKAWKRISYIHSMYHNADIEKQAVLIYGKSGEGKTYLLKEYVKQFKPVTTPEKTTVPVFYYSFRNPKKSVDEFIKLLISGLDGPVPKTRVSSSELEYQLITLLEELEVELIIFDEVQNLASSYDGIEFQNIIKYLCWLIETKSIKCSIVFAGSKFAKRLITFGSTKSKLVDGEHMARRHMRPICLQRILPKTAEWLSCVNWYMRKIGLPDLTVEHDKVLLDRIYVAYHERSMSSLRDILLKPECFEVGTVNELLPILRENFELYCKGTINPFDETLLSDDEVLVFTKSIGHAMKTKAITEKTKALAEFEL